MKVQFFLALGFLAALSPAQAAFNIVDPTYSSSTYFTHSNSDSIVSFDWGSDNNVYYMTSPNDFSGSFGGVYKYNGSTVSTAVTGGSGFAGASVVASGANIYYNTADIYKYGPVTGSPTNSSASSSPNYYLNIYSGGMFIAGSSPTSGNNNAIYYSSIGGDGSLGTFVNLGSTGIGFSGPLTFDGAGNMYYAPGFSDTSIYKWSATEVADAISGTALSIAGHEWASYGSTYSTVSGSTSMVVVGDELVVSLTSFTDPSLLVSFGIDGTGSYSSVTDVIGEDSERLGEVRYKDGSLYVSSGNQVVQVVPEPQTWMMLFAGLAMVSFTVYRRRRS